MRPKPVWTSSATKTMPCFLAGGVEDLEEARGRDDEAAFAEDGLDDDWRRRARRRHSGEDVCQAFARNK